MKPNIKKLLLCLAIPLAVGGLSALLSGGMDSYDSLRQPPLSPPGWVFPVVWSILYLLMGYSCYRVLTSGATQTAVYNGLSLYAIQLVLNFLWTPVFFGLQWRLVALLILIGLWVAVLLTIRTFSDMDQKAGDLLLPYLIWITFAGYLNFAVYLLNK